jgi:TetR/AcrR family transcriptional repressor of nem operon
VARAREFDTNQALIDAMMVFWEQGYENTSLKDIVSATKVSRYGLYDEFDSKKGLYLAALQEYFNQMLHTNMSGIIQADSKVEGIRDMVEGQIAMHKSGMAHGCMFCNAANEMGSHDPEVQALVQKCFMRIKGYLANCIQNSVDAGELPKDTQVEQKAMLMLGLIQGGATFIRTGMDADAIIDYMRSSLDVII